MSVRKDGRRARELTSASVAIDHLKPGEHISPIHETNKKAIVTFLFIVFGGTLLTIGTIIDSRLLYWMGGFVLFWTGIYLVYQSRLKSPCSPQ
jgi:hypothetical protein